MSRPDSKKSINFLNIKIINNWAYYLEGWYVGNMTFGTSSITNSMHSSYPKETQVNWVVTMYFPATGSKPMKIVDMPINNVKDIGLKALILYSGYKEMYVAISPNHGPAEYTFGVIR